MYVALGQLTKLGPIDPEFLERMGNIETICQAVHAAGVVAEKGSDSFEACLKRAIELHVHPEGPELDEQTAAQQIADEMASAGPNWLLWGAIGGAVLIGGALWFTRR